MPTQRAWSVGGCPRTSRRRDIDAISEALDVAGVRNLARDAYTENAPDRHGSGSIYLNEGT